MQLQSYSKKVRAWSTGTGFLPAWSASRGSATGKAMSETTRFLDGCSSMEDHHSMITTVTQKNMVTIPAEVGRKLGIRPGWKLDWQPVEGKEEILVRVIPDRGEQARRLLGAGLQGRLSFHLTGTPARYKSAIASSGRYIYRRCTFRCRLGRCCCSHRCRCSRAGPGCRKARTWRTRSRSSSSSCPPGRW